MIDQTPSNNSYALRRLSQEIARDRARLAERLDAMGVVDNDEVPTAETKKGRLYRVFALMEG